MINLNTPTWRTIERIGTLLAFLALIIGAGRWAGQIESKLDQYAINHIKTAAEVQTVHNELHVERDERIEADTRLEAQSAAEYSKLNLKITEVEKTLTTNQHWIIMYLKGEIPEDHNGTEY